MRDREDRLATLFLGNPRSALEQARLIMEESARYNVGNISRNFNLPTLALEFLTPDHRARFVYRADPVAGLWVPARMEERYVRRGDPSEVRGTATYSNFRRFQVRTSEDVSR